MMIESASLKLGVIGCGWVTELFHLTALQKVTNVDVVAVADEDSDRAKRVAERFHVPRRYSDHMALLEDPAVEAVLVWLPADCQAEVAQDVLKAGKHLFIDKPLVFDLSVWDGLIEQARRADRNIMAVGLPRRWHPLMRRARAVVDREKLGKINMIRTVLTGRNAERRTIKEVGVRHRVRGLLYEFGIHHFDVMQMLVRSPVAEIYAVHSADDMTFAVTTRFTDGAMMFSTFSEGANYNDEVEIYGQAGRLRVSCYRFDGFELFPSTIYPGDTKVRAQQAVNNLKQLRRGVMQFGHGGDFIDSYRAGWQHGVDAIRERTRPDCTLVEARGALRLYLAAKESLDLGSPVKLDSPVHDPVKT
jgi:UDP-N-acetylglucosamine 3-dehydrogenase